MAKLARDRADRAFQCARWGFELEYQSKQSKQIGHRRALWDIERSEGALRASSWVEGSGGAVRSSLEPAAPPAAWLHGGRVTTDEEWAELGEAMAEDADASRKKKERKERKNKNAGLWPALRQEDEVQRVQSPPPPSNLSPVSQRSPVRSTPQYSGDC